MRNIKYIVAHCTATDQNATPEAILRYWRERRGWRNPGYHYLIDKDGVIHQLQDEDKIANGVRGFNQVSIHVCYIGGKDYDDRTDMQKAIMLGLMKDLRDRYPNAKIQGHRDFLTREKSGWKECPRFNAKDEYNF